MNTGAEGVETAIKLARKWGYLVKGIAKDKGIIFSFTGNFHGRTFGPISLSNEAESRRDYGPFIPLIGTQCDVVETGHLRYA